MNKDDEDAVGYGKPPKEHQFKKGQSGNPRGRPKQKRSLKDLVVAELDRTHEVTDKGRKRRVTGWQLAAAALVRKAYKGDTRAFQEVDAQTRPREADTNPPFLFDLRSLAGLRDL